MDFHYVCETFAWPGRSLALARQPVLHVSPWTVRPGGHVQDRRSHPERASGQAERFLTCACGRVTYKLVITLVAMMLQWDIPMLFRRICIALVTQHF